MGHVNFQLKNDGNYAEVERAIFASIHQHLPHGTFGFEIKPQRNAVNMTTFFGRGGDVFMSHGVADKNYTYKRNFGGQFAINEFGAVLVPGPWMKDKLLSTEGITLLPDQILPVGWPRLDSLLLENRPRNPNKNVKVLWAPTHDARRHGKDMISTSSYPAFLQYTEELARHVELSIGLHPRNRTNKAPTAIPLLEADVVISDFGTMVYEAWALGKPVVFPYWIVGEGVQQYRPGSAEAYIFEKRLGYHPNSFSEMIEMLQSPLSVGSDVVDFMEEYLPSSSRGRSGEIISRHLEAMSENIAELRQQANFGYIQGARIASIEAADRTRKSDRELKDRLRQAERKIGVLEEKIAGRIKPNRSYGARLWNKLIRRRFQK